MKKSNSAKEIAQNDPVIPGNELDRVVTRILRSLRFGKPAHLPGLGTITPGKDWTFVPERKP